MGLVLHEVGGHGLAMTILGCGFDGPNLTYFAGGSARPTPCPSPWPFRNLVIISLHRLKQSATTLGAAELLQYVAFRVEAAIRSDTLPGIEVAAAQRTAFLQGAPWLPIHQFPIRRVLVVIGVAALARPVRCREGAPAAAPGRIRRRHAVGVAVAALACAITITVLVRVGRTTPTEPVLVGPPQPPPVMAPKGPA